MSPTVSTIDYKALAERIKREARRMASNAALYREIGNGKAAKHIDPFVADLRTVVSLLDGMADAKPDGEVVAVSPTDAIVRWAGRSRPTVGASVYLHPAPQPHDVTRLVDALQSIRKHVADQPSALAKAIVATCDSALAGAPQPEPIDPHMIVAEDRFPDGLPQKLVETMRDMADERQPVSELTRWKVGNELAPYHPDASHVEPGYRDGWNACYRAMRESEPTEAQIECHGLDTPERVCFYEQEFYVLSNFSAFQLEWRGATYPTSEHAYQATKFLSHRHDIALRIRNAPSAHEAFKIAERHKADCRPDWDETKVGVMLDILHAKAMQHEYVRRKLLATGDRELVENSWRDDFWGWGPNRNGQNMLGKLWMEVRAELRAALAARESK